MHQNVDRDQNMMNGINEDSRYRTEKTHSFKQWNLVKFKGKTTLTQQYFSKYQHTISFTVQYCWL